MNSLALTSADLCNLAAIPYSISQKRITHTVMSCLHNIFHHVSTKPGPERDLSCPYLEILDNGSIIVYSFPDQTFSKSPSVVGIVII